MTTEYFAVPDPDLPDRMTYWRSTDGVFRPYPRGSRYGPECPRRAFGLTQTERRMWDAYRAWWARVEQAIDADPAGARRRFAMSLSRCSACGRKIWDEASVNAGMGPECRGE
jgi:hypothetical protein